MNAKYILCLMIVFALAGSIQSDYFQSKNNTLFNSGRIGRVAQVEKQFMRFIIKYDKNYQSMDQYLYRLGVFDSNLKKFQAHNKDRNKSHQMGINFFADMLPQDLEGKKPPITQASKSVKTLEQQQFSFSNFSSKKIGGDSKTIDWTKHNVVPPVKDGGILGSGTDQLLTFCIDSANAIKSSTPLTDYYAEEELMDCTQDLQSAIQFTVSKGLETVQDYNNSSDDEESSDTSYTSSNSYKNNMKEKKGEKKCNYDPTKPAIRVKEWDLIQSGSYAKTEMVNQLQKQPLVVLVNADAGDFMYYMGGVLRDGCPEEDIQLNHSLLLVGYDQEKDTWKLQNTWGSSWGEQGYIRMGSGINLCGVEQYPLVAVLY